MNSFLGIIAALFTMTSAHALVPEHFITGTAAGVRDFYLYSPAHPQGLVVMLHGCKTTAAEFDQGTEMSQFATTKNFAVLYPEQSVLGNYDRCWNWFWGSETSIIAEGIREVQKRFHLRRENTFLMGMSAGAAQGAILANCNRDLLSGVLLHSGIQFMATNELGRAQDVLDHGALVDSGTAALAALQCNPSKAPLTFMIVYGTEDQRVNPINSEQNAKELLMLNQLLTQGSGKVLSTVSQVPPVSPSLGYEQRDYSMDGIFTGSVVKVAGLAHEWSGGNSLLPRNNPNGPSAVKIFFEKFVH